jgi:hypothetical protein
MRAGDRRLKSEISDKTPDRQLDHGRIKTGLKACCFSSPVVAVPTGLACHLWVLGQRTHVGVFLIARHLFACVAELALHMIRRISLSLLLLSVLLAQGWSSVCQAQCAEQQVVSPGNTSLAAPAPGHCHGMRMAQASQQCFDLRGVQPCSSHICAADLSALGQKTWCDHGKLVLESSALPRDIVVAPLPSRATREAIQPPRSMLHFSAVDPLTNSLRV